MQFRRVLDLTVVFLVEIYREKGQTFGEIMDLLLRHLKPAEAGAPPKPKGPSVEQESSSMALLKAQMAGTDFRGMG